MSSNNDVPSWGIPLMDAYESDPEAPEAAPQSSDQAPLSPAHALVYSEYLAPSDDDLEPDEAQPLLASASPTTLLLDYSVDSEPVEEDPKEDPEEDLEEEPSEEEELSAPANSPPAKLYINLPSEVEDDELPSTPPSPTSYHHIIPLSNTGLRRTRMLVRPQTPLSPAIDALVDSWKRARFSSPSYRFEIGKSSAAAAARQHGSTLARGTDYGFVTALEEVNERVIDHATSHRHDSEEFHVEVRELQQHRRDDVDRMTRFMQRTKDREDARDLERHDRPADAGSNEILCLTLLCEFRKMPPKKSNMSEAAINELIAQCVADALAEYKANRNSGTRNGNGNDNGNESHDSGSNGGRTSHIAHITVGHDAAYGMSWKTLIKMMTENYYPRNKMEKYTGGLPDSIQGSVMASEPTKLQELIELARSLMDQKILTYAARQAKNKRIMGNKSRNNHAQQPANKRQNVARASAAGPGEKSEYAGTLPLCNK
ncbi:hypothetical protein Tco_1191655 [Tanacetum coccineum]